jgi:hypothetical protein
VSTNEDKLVDDLMFRGAAWSRNGMRVDPYVEGPPVIGTPIAATPLPADRSDAPRTICERPIKLVVE